MYHWVAAPVWPLVPLPLWLEHYGLREASDR
jgi:hypothetical protein